MAEAVGQATDEVADGIKRALDAAEAANEAAQDIESLQASYKAFAEAVIRGQRRNTLFAAGAAAGAAVAIAMGGIVYFRSVADLRVAAAVQSEAAALMVEELTQIDKIGDVVEEQQDRMKTELLDLLEKVKDEIRRAALEGDAPDAPVVEQETAAMDAQVATAIREGVKADLESVRDEILEALAEIEVAAQGVDTAELTALVAELKAVAAAGGRVERAAQAPAPAQATTSRPAKPKPKPAPEPDPFTYP
jgi:hypothetical protein